MFLLLDFKKNVQIKEKKCAEQTRPRVSVVLRLYVSQLFAVVTRSVE